MITIKNLSKACDVSDYMMSKLLRNLGIDVLLNEATRLQSMHYWDKKSLPPESEIDIRFVKQAYRALTEDKTEEPTTNE